MKMSDSDRRKVLKRVLQLISQLLWLMGLLVALSGFYLLLFYGKSSLFFTHRYIILPAVFALASAAVLVVVGCLGSLLSFRDSIFLQGLFVFLLVLVFTLESTASALAFFHSKKLDSELASLSGMFQQYTGSSQSHISWAVDGAQEELQCCGVQDYKDWMGTPWFNRTGGLSVPCSCCNSTFLSCNGTLDQPWKLYSQGCQVKLETVLQFVLGFIIWGFPVVFLLEVVSFVTMGLLMKEQPLLKYQVLDRKYIF